MARYPITNAQYQPFAELEGAEYGDDAYWRDIPGPFAADPSQHPQDNRPKTVVTWAEAMAYCRWLTARLRALPADDPRRLGADETLTLLTEDQWLLAAHGPGDTLEALAARGYPWGGAWEPGIANCNEQGTDGRQAVPADPKGSNLVQTTAVGLYPRGAARPANDAGEPGILDAYGNVWAWCLNKAQAPDDCTPDAESQRAFRGGGFGFAGGLSRAALRFRLFPFVRSSVNGLRVCVAPPPWTADH